MTPASPNGDVRAIAAPRTGFSAAGIGFAAAGIAAGLSSLVLWAGSRFVAPTAVAPDVTGGYWLPCSFLLLPVVATAAVLFERLWLQSLLARWFRSRVAAALAVAVGIGLLAGALLQPGFVAQGVAALLGEGLVLGLAYLLAGLPGAVIGQIVLQFWQQGLALWGAGIRPAALSGWAALALAVLVPAAYWLWERRRRKPIRE